MCDGIFPGTARRVRLIKPVLIMAAVCLFLLLDTRESYACVCRPPGSPTAEMTRSDSVFRGRVVTVYPATIKYSPLEVFPTEIYEFRVMAVWKGPLYETVYRDIVAAGSTCARWFSLGSEYLVYGSGALCTRTRLISEAQEDLAEIGEGRVPEPGTSGPVPREVLRLEKLLKAADDQSPTGGQAAPTPRATLEAKTPTPTPAFATPTPTTRAVPQAPTPGAAAPTLNPEASEGQASRLWPIIVLGAVLVSVLIGSVALVRTHRSQRSTK